MTRIVKGGLIQCTNPINDESRPVPEIQAAAFEKHVPFIERAGESGVKILCLQEIFNGPYFCPSQDARWYDAAEPIPGPSTEALAKVASTSSFVKVPGSALPFCGQGRFQLQKQPSCLFAPGSFVQA